MQVLQLFCGLCSGADRERQKHSLTGQVSGVEPRRSSSGKAESMGAGQSLNTTAFKRCLFNLCPSMHFPAWLSDRCGPAGTHRQSDLYLRPHHHQPPPTSLSKWLQLQCCSSAIHCCAALCSATTGKQWRNAAQWLI